MQLVASHGSFPTHERMFAQWCDINSNLTNHTGRAVDVTQHPEPGSRDAVEAGVMRAFAKIAMILIMVALVIVAILAATTT